MCRLIWEPRKAVPVVDINTCKERTPRAYALPQLLDFCDVSLPTNVSIDKTSPSAGTHRRSNLAQKT